MTDAAVIDVGSNSVRLVIYRIEGRAIWTVFNEKVLAGLGRDLAGTGRLSPEGVSAALAALRRFKAVVDGAHVDTVFATATAAAREAADGPAFIEQVKAATGFSVRILAGADEARYAALGVIAGTPDAEGVVGDLGGSSLELTRVGGQQPGRGVTLPLGPFALGAPAPFDPVRTRPQIAKRLNAAVRGYGGRTFYAVGGAWRNIALLHLRMAGYPLQIVHQYELSAVEAIEAARFIAQQSRGSLERIQGVTKKRIDTLPYAAAVLESLIETLGFERISVSAYGLREGLLFEHMSPSVRALDPLIEGCRAMGARSDTAEELGAALETWLTPAFAALPPLFGDRDPVLLAAACRLADLGARLHPDHRADLVFEQVLRAPVPGVTHAERAFLAAAAFNRHTASWPPPERETLTRILTPERQRRARALGAAMRLACDLSGRSPALLARSRLETGDGAIRLIAEPAWADMLLGEQTAKRAATLADQLGLGLTMKAAA